MTTEAPTELVTTTSNGVEKAKAPEKKFTFLQACGMNSESHPHMAPRDTAGFIARTPQWHKCCALATLTPRPLARSARPQR